MFIEVTKRIEIDAGTAATIGYYLARHGKIAAIKYLREITDGCGLKAAKDAVERIEVVVRNNSELDYPDSDPANLPRW